MRITWKLSEIKKVFIVSCGFMTFGCSHSGIQTSSGEQATNVIAVFERGEARLNCDVSCSGAWGSARNRAKILYEQGLWRDLAIEVSRVGFKADQTYFYLGRAAEELGHADAARTYYKLGLASPYKCDGLFNNCDGLVFPNEISAGINRLPKAVNTEKSIVTGSKNASISESEKPIVKNAEDKSLLIEKSLEAIPKQAAVVNRNLQPSNSSLYNVETIDDPFNPFIEFNAPRIKIGEATFSLGAMKNRTTGVVSYKILFANMYSGGGWQNYSAATLLGGTQLETEKAGSDVRCRSYRNCTYFEIITIKLPRSSLNSRVSVKIFGSTDQPVINLDEAYVRDLVQAVESHH